ncbi:MAG: diguanylate cyclase [Gammaproteobacteria bacterium]
MTSPQSTRYSFLASIVVALMLIGIVELLIRQTNERHAERQRAEVISQLAEVRARLQSEIRISLDLTHSLVSYIEAQPDVTQQEFERIARIILGVSDTIRNVALATNHIVTHTYPFAGNEAALGLNYRDNAEQWQAVERAMTLQTTIVGGPNKLVQGGRGFLIRTPIYANPSTLAVDEDIGRPIWGMATLVIDEEKMRDRVNFYKHRNSIHVALRGKDGRGAEGEVIWGDVNVFAKDPVIMRIELPEGYWQLAAIPVFGWDKPDNNLLLMRMLGWLLALLVAMLVFLLMRAYNQNREMALHDQLTGLPNRRLLEDRINQAIKYAAREQNSFALIFIDVDDFKIVNDRHGHRNGDRVLIEIANRLNGHFRDSDTIARIGGDEFVVVLPDVSSIDSANSRVASVKNILNEPLIINGEDIALRASIGVAMYPDSGSDVDSLLTQADDAMYLQKSNKSKP